MRIIKKFLKELEIYSLAFSCENKSPIILFGDYVHYIAYACLGGIALLAVALAIYMFIKRRSGYEMLPLQDMQGAAGANACDMVLFYADWCPMCEKMRPEWEKMKLALLGSRRVNIMELEHKQIDQQRHNIKGFPTIRLYPSGLSSNTYVDYHGNHNADAYINFALNPPVNSASL